MFIKGFHDTKVCREKYFPFKSLILLSVKQNLSYCWLYFINCVNITHLFIAKGVLPFRKLFCRWSILELCLWFLISSKYFFQTLVLLKRIKSFIRLKNFGIYIILMKLVSINSFLIIVDLFIMFKLCYHKLIYSNCLAMKTIRV